MPSYVALLREELVALLPALLHSPTCVGLEVTVFDPDLDPEATSRV